MAYLAEDALLSIEEIENLKKIVQSMENDIENDKEES
jgi:hypothetical protein